VLVITSIYSCPGRILVVGECTKKYIAGDVCWKRRNSNLEFECIFVDLKPDCFNKNEREV
jgi:hypothetical protein